MKRLALGITEAFARPAPHSRRALKTHALPAQALLSVNGGQRAERGKHRAARHLPLEPNRAGTPAVLGAQ